MYEKWPRERNSSEQQVNDNNSLKTTQEFLAIFHIFRNGFPNEFEDAVTWIVEHDGSFEELEQRITTIVVTANLQNYPDSKSLLMTLVCANALAHSPLLKTWSKVNAFKYQSWQIEHWLNKGMTAFAEINPTAGHAYVEIAKEAFTGLNNFTLHSISDRINEERASALSHWNECRNKLDEIWWNLRGWHGFMNYAEELPLFQLFYKLEPDEFIRALSGSSNPYLVNSLLLGAGIGSFSPKFSEWKLILAGAPVAFEDDGRWNGSVLVPLLLIEADNQLLNARESFINSDLTSDEIEKFKQEITSTAELIAVTLATRKDAAAIISRWTPWLMRHILSHTSKNVTDVKSSAFFADTLIDAIGRNLNNISLLQKSPKDAASWETWCYRCVLSSFAYNEYVHVPFGEDFGHEWFINPEDWAGKKGILLREHASLITTFHKEIPGMAANLLAYPLGLFSSPGLEWKKLWNNAITLREILEFGDSDVGSDDYSARSDAGRLLFLLFCIGMAIFDQGAAQCSSNRSPEADSLVDLYKELIAALHEMREIDSTLNRDKWFLVFQHLTVRRMIWQNSLGDEREYVNFQIFKTTDTPTVIDLLSEVKGDVIDFIATFQSLRLNNLDFSRLKADFYSASISLPDIVNSIIRLNKCHPLKYPIEESHIKNLKEIL